MSTTARENQKSSFKELVAALVNSAANDAQREAVSRILPRMEEYAETTLQDANKLAEARLHLSEAFLGTLGPDAAQSGLAKVVADARSIADPIQRAAAIAEAAQHAGALGGLGTDLLDQLAELAAEFEPGVVKAHLFAALCVSYNRARDSKKAGKMAIRALNTAEKPADLEERVTALSTVAVELRKIGSTGDVTEALERAQILAERIEDKVSRCRAFVSLAAALCKAGQGDKSLTALVKEFGNGNGNGSATSAPAVEAAEPTAAEAELASPPEEEQEPRPTNGSSTFLEEPQKLDDSWNDPTRGVAFPSFTGGRRKRR